MMLPISASYFWITNISKRNVSLRDLGITVPAGRSWNLLDKRHHSFTPEELYQSATNGSLATKCDKIVIRKYPPAINTQPKIEIVTNPTIPTRRRSTVQIEQTYHEELDMSDDAILDQPTDPTDR